MDRGCAHASPADRARGTGPGRSLLRRPGGTAAVRAAPGHHARPLRRRDRGGAPDGHGRPRARGAPRAPRGAPAGAPGRRGARRVALATPTGTGATLHGGRAQPGTRPGLRSVHPRRNAAGPLEGSGGCATRRRMRIPALRKDAPISESPQALGAGRGEALRPRRPLPAERPDRASRATDSIRSGAGHLCIYNATRQC